MSMTKKELIAKYEEKFNEYCELTGAKTHYTHKNVYNKRASLDAIERAINVVTYDVECNKVNKYWDTHNEEREALEARRAEAMHRLMGVREEVKSRVKVDGLTIRNLRIRNGYTYIEFATTENRLDFNTFTLTLDTTFGKYDYKVDVGTTGAFDVFDESRESRANLYIKMGAFLADKRAIQGIIAILEECESKAYEIEKVIDAIDEEFKHPNM